MATPSPFVAPFYLSDAGAPLASGLLYTYDAGTSTPKTTYVDSAGLTANTNPIVLDAAGRASIYLGEGGYKLVLKDSLGNTLWTRDAINNAGLVGSYQVISTIADLKSLPGGVANFIQVVGYYAASDNAGGLFRWDSSSSTADNAGTIIQPNSAPATGRWIRVYTGAVNVKWFGAKGDGITNDTAALNNLITVFTAAGAEMYFDAGTYLITSGVTVPASIRVKRHKLAKLTASSAISFTCTGPFQDIPSQFFAGSAVAVFNSRSTRYTRPEWFGGAADDSTDNADPIRAAVSSFSGFLGEVRFSRGTYRVNSALLFTAAVNGVRWEGATRFDTILKFYLTSTDDGMTFNQNHNGLVLNNIRMTCDASNKGRDALVFRLNPQVGTDPDAGLYHLSNLDIRGWGRHGIVNGLTVATRTDHLEVLQNGGNGIIFQSVSPKATTWTDTGSWFHENDGHGIVLDGNTTPTLCGTISDSNGRRGGVLSPSTNAECIKYAGYTITCSAFPVAGLVIGDLGLSVQRTRAAVTTVIGTLAHFDNTSLELIINCTLAGGIAHVGGDTYQILTGTAGNCVASAVRQNTHGLYARNVAGMNWAGGHTENHFYGMFLDNCLDCTIAPGKSLTLGAGAWGNYIASTSTRIFFPATSIDVNAGGAGDLYIGELTRGIFIFGNHGGGGYTFTNRSKDVFVLTAENAAPLTLVLKSTGQIPWGFTGYHATGTLLSVGSGSAAGYAGYRMTVTGFTKDFYLDQATGDMLFGTAGQDKNIILLGSGADRANQRIFFASSDSQKAIGIGASNGIMTGSDAEADFTVDLYDDAGTLIITGLKISRAGRWMEILAGRGTQKGKVPAIIDQVFVDASNLNAAETDLYSKSILADVLGSNGDSLEFEFQGVFSAAVTNKRIRVKFGATVIFDSTARAFASSNWKVKGRIIRVTNTTQRAEVSWVDNDATAAYKTDLQYFTPGETLSGAVTFKVTGLAAATGEVTIKMGKMKWEPAS